MSSAAVLLELNAMSIVNIYMYGARCTRARYAVRRVACARGLQISEYFRMSVRVRVKHNENPTTRTKSEFMAALLLCVVLRTAW